MAPRLKQGEHTSATVHVLKPRKAKGASGTKRKAASTNRMKAPAHEQKPKRQTAAQKAAEAAFKTAAAAAAPAAAPAAAASVPAKAIALQPSDADIRRDLQDRLIALHTQLKPVEAKIIANSEIASQLKSTKGEIRGRIQGIIPLAVYDELRKKLDQKTKRSDNEQYEKLRALAFDAFGLPVGPQPELNLTAVPEAAKPAVYWEEVGYTTAVGNGAAKGGDFADPVRDGVPPENHQDYMRGFTRGTERNARGIGLLEVEPTPPVLAPASIPGGEMRAAAKELLETVIRDPDWSGFADDPADWSDEQQATFRSWYESLDPSQDVDITHLGVARAFDLAAQAEEAGEVAPAGDAAPSEMI